MKTVIIKNKSPNKIQKRSMMGSFEGGKGRPFSTIKHAIANGFNKEAVTTPKQDMVTWGVVVRKSTPQKVKPHPGVKGTTSDGKTELHSVDHSGKNHYMLGDIDSAKNSETINIYGVYTTKDTPYKTKKPRKVSDETLEDENKPQFLQEKYNTVILKKDVALDVNATIKIQTDSEHIKDCDRIAQEQNLV